MSLLTLTWTLRKLHIGAPPILYRLHRLYLSEPRRSSSHFIRTSIQHIIRVKYQSLLTLLSPKRRRSDSRSDRRCRGSDSGSMIKSRNPPTGHLNAERRAVAWVRAVLVGEGKGDEGGDEEKESGELVEHGGLGCGSVSCERVWR
ncbi:hypothetical protein HBH56_128790 [Parastagonospora nodorum]|uniref:Uncharacterized protein n=1 Tax=Phaeosphaeria nodorum (strain SN15 / ATCC MYA-4574 / FGSC 10173) TaxID=321614 RepID=A0A7U2NPE9_PHANO|nr:hypothetical protein HBH56_128790 [Parastagonospora nodorum]QRD05638.1 hypothetical protein JI435_304200 [Parastagonospora nodorum SN15]KAH3931636.1 hypothetical protein HBH54_094700 [Parastagonospora nodorum]KAH4135315.1 hypothetical protein HBH45_154340 [Parastagonospora nodorum]KAH4159458.1 hypothetical protein HBH44_104510 [Parastagonospora nodorum]